MNQTTAKKRILVVDDDPDVLKTFNALLTHHGYDVMEATYGLPGLFRVTDGAPDLILADIHMPKMNGLEFLRELKAHVDTRDIPVVVVTGAASEENRKAAFAAGCAGYMTKPVEAKVFLAQIENILNGHRHQHP